jgi:hypothetical protein
MIEIDIYEGGREREECLGMSVRVVEGREKERRKKAESFWGKKG